MSEAYASIAAKARLEALKLVYSEFDLKPEHAQGEPLSLEIGTHWVEQEHRADEGAVVGVCEWLFRGTRDNEAREAMFVVKARYLVHYSRVDADEGAAIAFLTDVGRMAVYPYFRAHVAMVTGAGGLVLPPLPTINIGTFQKRNQLGGRVGARQEQPAKEGDAGA